MTDVELFLRASADAKGLTVDDVLARVLHVEDGALTAVIESMDEATRALTVRLDRELRLRNPGLHYVIRKMYLGYRREGATSLPSGERSQVFASILRNNKRLEVVLPIDADTIRHISNASDLRGKGHHGVGDVRVAIGSDADIDRFLADFEQWLMPESDQAPKRARA